MCIYIIHTFPNKAAELKYGQWIVVDCHYQHPLCRGISRNLEGHFEWHLYMLPKLDGFYDCNSIATSSNYLTGCFIKWTSINRNLKEYSVSYASPGVKGWVVRFHRWFRLGGEIVFLAEVLFAAWITFIFHRCHDEVSEIGTWHSIGNQYLITPKYW